MEQYEGRRVLIVGLARSGVCAAKMLCELGASVTVNDMKTAEQLGEETMQALSALPCRQALGVAPDDLLGATEVLVLSPGIAYAKPFVQEAVRRGIEVIGELELGARVLRGRLVAITGTNGKTTTTTLTGEIFRATGKHTLVCGNIGYPITAEALTMGDDAVTVAEVSSYQCETVSRFHPDVAACLNITEDHLVRHGDMQTYIAMKHRIFENQTRHDAAVFNYDDPACREMARDLKAHIVWFSRKEKVDCGAYVDGEMVMFRMDRPVAVCRVNEIRIPGPHNLENALAAVAITGALGVSPEIMREVLMTFPGVEHRIETVRTLDGVTFINDSKGTNVDSTQKAIATMTRPTVLILGGSDKKVSFVPLAETIAAAPQIIHCVLIGDTAEQIRTALEAADIHRYTMAGYDFDHALAIAREQAPDGGCVLLSPACASFDMFKDFEDRGRIFKDKVNAMTSAREE
ncbi:MAG: UDP-N-acetylmuramoyl-L-alanine--D-glutamate ligase [Clostridia bacterium]|nr:UDP-N-acetylmuramoyl-L-alanine--D-glutamate ligase [Clostridia bacterium]